MSQTLKNKPYSKRAAAHKNEKRSRSSAKSEIFNTWYSEAIEKGLESANRFKPGIFILIVLLLFSSCVSKKHLVEEQGKTKQYANNFL